MALQIVVADDDGSMLHILTHILSAEGFEVFAESNGIAALETARRIRPALIVLDLIMPQLDGIGVLLRLYGEDPPLDCPAILLTGQDTGEFSELVESLEKVKFVEKPFELDDFIQTVRTCVGADKLAK